MADSVIQLKCSCNNYPWGKSGTDSLAARLCSQIPGTDFKIENDKQYAEMWMGTYPTTPSYDLKSGESLQDILNANKEKLIGKTVLSKFGADLPFLPKILSIQKALPLQIHPDIELSKQLHAKDPDKFSDTNHKPEIAIALTDFEAFCGFKPKHDIQQLLQLEPLRQFHPNKDHNQWTDTTLREICRVMLLADESTVSQTLNALKTTPKSSSLLRNSNGSYIPDLVPRLIDQYGATDNGSLVALILMNYMTFSPGEAIWIPADGIHAYLHGDIVECMARSDNVLNTGFCPRADRDSVDTFVSALTFQQHDSNKPLLKRQRYQGSSSQGKTWLFQPPMGEFNMLVTELTQQGETEELTAVRGPSVAFTTKGKGRMIVDGRGYDAGEGAIFFIGQSVDVKYECEAEDGLTVYRAYAE